MQLLGLSTLHVTNIFSRISHMVCIIFIFYHQTCQDSFNEQISLMVLILFNGQIYEIFVYLLTLRDMPLFLRRGWDEDALSTTLLKTRTFL